MSHIEAVYRDHRRQCVNRAYGLLRNTADAEDAVQDAFVEALEKGHQDDPNLLGWIHAATRHRGLNIAKAASVRDDANVCVAVPASYENSTPNEDVLDLVRSAVTQLFPAERASLGCTRRSDSVASLKAHQRALKHLRAILQQTQAYKEGVFTTCI